MAIAPKIKHVDQRPNGVLRFRRRFPKDVAEHLGQPAFQVHIRNTSGLEFQKEYYAILTDFERIVAQTRAELNADDTRAPIERWHDALLKAEGLLSETHGLDDDLGEGETFARHEIAKSLANLPKTDPLLINALVNPEAPAPKPTLGDALRLYRRDRHIEERSKEGGDLQRITARLEKALGDIDSLPLEEMRVDHRRRYLDHMLATKKADGSTLSVSSARRETNVVVAAVNHAIKEMDIVAKNHFADLPWPKQDTLAVEKRLPLKDDLVACVSARLTDDLRPLWSLLAGTGMRLSEAVGLLKEDIVLDHSIPHVIIRPNSIRRIKTISSQRTAPLVGEALRAAKEALEGAESEKSVFPRYARPRGADAASAALMKHVRQETADIRFSVHGLRHRVSDKLREAGAPIEVRHGFLGHANEAIAESTYGGREARLREFQKWARMAGL